MAKGSSGAIVGLFQGLFGGGASGSRTDSQLLDRFSLGDGEGAEAAFAALVARHGPMVSRVCRAVLRDRHDAEDAFQATFLVLARRSRSIRRKDSLASWLHGVALRTSSCLRRRAESTRRREREGAIMANRKRQDDPAPDPDLGPVLHEEVERLPERLRGPVVLCYFEGLTHDAAAADLGVPVGTIRSRLAAARDRLRPRLARRGLAPAAEGLGSTPAQGRAVEAVPVALADATVRLVAGGGTAIPARILMILKESTKTMLLARLAGFGSAMAALGLAASAASWVAAGGDDDGPAPAPFRVDAPSPAARDDAAKPDAQGPIRDDATPRPSPWRAYGRVIDQDGRPLPGVEVWANCGVGTLLRTGHATSGADGRYEMDFGRGITSLTGQVSIQAATITAHKAGYFEENLGRQGDCRAATGVPSEEQLKAWGGNGKRLFLPDRPLEINFTMRPAGRVAGRLVDEQGRPLAKYSVSLTGADLPPSSSVLCSARADDQGRFSFDGIPTTFKFQFEVRMAEVQPPWDDTWASAALRFGRPEAGDLRAWFGEREIRLREFVLRVAGPGIHGREAVPIAGNRGTLDLTDAAEVAEKSATLLDAGSAILTLRNAPAPDPGRSLVSGSAPSPPAGRSGARLARTRPDEAGECTISFENPAGFDLEPGKHQVIFQVFVGSSQKPTRERILRQVDARKEGRYRVKVKLPPESLEDSRVSITFVTIQPDHDAWVKAFFVEGKGTKYKGIWAGDGAPMPAIPLEADAGR